MFSPFSSSTLKPTPSGSGISPFGTPTAGSSTQFGGGSSFFSGSAGASSIPPFSTPNIPYQPSKDIEGSLSITIHSISAMPNYLGKSFDEIRLEDYALGRKGKTSSFPSTSGYLLGQSQTSAPSSFGSSANAPSTSLFGQTQQQPQQSGMFSTLGSSLYGTTPSSSFAQPQMQPTTSFGTASGGFGATSGNFGAPSTSGFGTTSGAPMASSFGSSTPSLFGQPPQQPTSGFTFGQQQPPQPSSSGLFGQTQSQPQQQSSLFGTQSTGGLFGSTPSTASGGLFGQPPSTAPSASTMTFGAPKPPTQTTLFGTTAPAPSTGSTGLFGSQPSTTGTSLFGAPTSQPSGSLSSFGSSLFKSAEAPQTTSTTGLFGTTPSTSSTGLFGAKPNSLFTPPSSGFSSSQPQQPFSFGSTTAAAPSLSQQLKPSLGGLVTSGANLPVIAPPPELLSIAPPIHPSLKSTYKPSPLTPPNSAPSPPIQQQFTQVTQPARQQTVEKLIPKITGSIVPITKKTSDVKKLVITSQQDEGVLFPKQQDREDILKIGDFYMEPSESALKKMSQFQLKSIEGFIVGQKGLGEIRFSKPVDLSEVDLDRIFVDIVRFEPKQVVVYPEADREGAAAKPSPGQGLNQPAIVKLERCWPTARGTRVPITDPANERMKHHIERLKSVPDTRFLSFDHITGTWEFKVEHFSKYEMYAERGDGESPNEVK
jgi:nuclear pore complex protein Nup98-Nup96